MSTQHTPGPWVAKESLGTNDQFCGYEIEQHRKEGDYNYRGNVAWLNHAEHIEGITRAEAESNARLIAAAPDLLAALLKVLPLAEEALSHPSLSVEILDAHAAIAKARTGQQGRMQVAGASGSDDPKGTQGDAS